MEVNVRDAAVLGMTVQVAIGRRQGVSRACKSAEERISRRFTFIEEGRLP
jgi:hypothetical protein